MPSLQRILIPALLLVLSCSEPKQKYTRFTAEFKAPQFDDRDRKKILEETFPVIDSMFRTYAIENHFPALAYGIVADGELIHAGASGSINLKTNTAATTKSLFRIASMTKSFTAMAILKLRDEGMLSLEDPVSKYIAEVADVTYPTQDSPELTIQNLLTMSAGFPEDNPWGDRQLADTPDQLISFIKEGLSFSNAPAKEFEYSNLGYAMLGMVVSSVSGMPYELFITQNILIPLGMTDTKWEYSEVDPKLLALGYRWEDSQWKEEPLLHDGIYGAMGGLITSVEDFSKYVNLHIAAWPPRNGDDTGPIKRSSIREMHKPWQFRSLDTFTDSNGEVCASTGGYGYGLGWRRNCKGVERVSHSGGLPGFGSEYRFYPEYGVGLICFANLTYASAGDANANVMDTLFSMTGLKPRTIQISDTLQLRGKQIVELLTNWNEALEKKILAENFYLDLSRETWIKNANELFKNTGTIVTVDPIIPENQLRGKFFVRGERQDIEIFFTLTPEHAPKIQQLDITPHKKQPK
ncbi:MAG TPA: serine hydrolase domain-containing protein [Chryseolinea sp.]|nr:serine hydrolase domain-containing protein [Chryseolinea sp.]